jgi:8-oxo-dGTP diphosphatase
MDQNVIQVSAAFLVKDRTLFVAQRTENDDNPLKWELPGGKLKSGEKYDEALIREFKEEFNTDITVTQEVGSVEVDSPGQVLIVMFFLVEGDHESISGTQHNDTKYVNYEQLSQLDLCAADSQFIELYKDEILNFID